MIFSSNARCYNAKHAWMPTARACHNACVARRIELFVDGFNGRSENFLFHFLTRTVLLIQLYRKRTCFVFIVCEQETQRFLRGAQAASGIQAWPQSIPNVMWRNRRTHP